MKQYSLVSKLGSREINEDSLAYVKSGNTEAYIVADGLGGHGYGEVASATVVQAVKEYVERADTTDLEQLLRDAIEHAQKTLLDHQAKTGMRSEMKTTIVVLCSDGTNCCWAHVGDSRLYAFCKNKVKFHTLDHSIPQMLVMSREISEKKIRNHPQRNMLLRVMGIEWDRPKYEVSELCKEEDFQAFLLCSDGFWELIEDKEMGKLLKKSDTAEQWLAEMTKVVEKNGQKKDMDNYTAIAVRI